MARVQQRFGVGHLGDVLPGANTENIRKYGHDELSTYGLLKELDKKSVTALTYQLLDQNLLSRTEGDYPLVTLNPASMEVLRGTRQVKLVQPAKSVRKKPARRRWTFVAWTRACSITCAWRRRLAEAEKVPPYTIFADTTLVALCRIRPTKITSLPLITGIGEKRTARFGEALCSEIASYCREHNLSADAFTPPPPPAPSPSKKTTGGAMKEAFELFQAGHSIPEVAQKLDPAISTTSAYLEQFIRECQPASIDPWIDPATQHRIKSAVGDQPITGLKPIFEKLNGEVAYDIIRLVLAPAAPTIRILPFASTGVRSRVCFGGNAHDSRSSLPDGR